MERFSNEGTLEEVLPFGSAHTKKILQAVYIQYIYNLNFTRWFLTERDFLILMSMSGGGALIGCGMKLRSEVQVVFFRRENEEQSSNTVREKTIVSRSRKKKVTSHCWAGWRGGCRRRRLFVWDGEDDEEERSWKPSSSV